MPLCLYVCPCACCRQSACMYLFLPGLCLSICLAACQSICLPVYQSACLSVCHSRFLFRGAPEPDQAEKNIRVCLLACLPYVCMPACVYACLSSCRAAFRSVWLLVCLSVDMPVCLTVCRPICLYVSLLSVCMPACLSACLSVSLLPCRLLCLYVSLFVFLPACLTVCWSFCPHVCLLARVPSNLSACLSVSAFCNTRRLSPYLFVYLCERFLCLCCTTLSVCLLLCLPKCQSVSLLIIGGQNGFPFRSD